MLRCGASVLLITCREDAKIQECAATSHLAKYPEVCSLPVFVLGVKQACCEFLESQLDPSNCLGIRDFAETHNCVDLMQAAEVFSQKHFPEVVQHEEFILLSQGEVEKLIKCDEIQVQLWLLLQFL